MSKTLVSTPPTNRGVLSTSDFLLDWLSFTLPYHFDQSITVNRGEGGKDEYYQYITLMMSEVIELFGELQPRPGGVKGYPLSFSMDCGGLVGIDPSRPEQRIYVNLSASALATFAMEPKKLINKILGLSASVTRLDLARDDFEGLLDLDVIEYKLRSGELTTRYRKARPLSEFPIGGIDDIGKTVYVGSKESKSLFRFYDKAAEQGHSGEYHHIRCELQTRNEVAHRLAEIINEADGVELSQTLAGLIYNYIDFKIPGSDTNKSRWGTVEWWKEFLAVGSKVPLGIAKVQKSIQDAQKWAWEQIAVSWATMDEIDPFFILSVVRKGREIMLNDRFYQQRLNRWSKDWQSSGSYLPPDVNTSSMVGVGDALAGLAKSKEAKRVLRDIPKQGVWGTAFPT